MADNSQNTSLQPAGDDKTDLADITKSVEEFSALSREVNEATQGLVSPMLSAGKVYLTIITVAGYAGVFTIWGHMKPELAPPLNNLVALLLTVSITVFVGFQAQKSRNSDGVVNCPINSHK